jgi:hypothetical protein
METLETRYQKYDRVEKENEQDHFFLLIFGFKKNLIDKYQ